MPYYSLIVKINQQKRSEVIRSGIKEHRLR